MKTLKAICTAALLALVLSVSVFAGEIGTPGAPKASGEITTPGTITPDPTYDQDSGDPASEPGDISTPGFAEILDALLFMIY